MSHGTRMWEEGYRGREGCKRRMGGGKVGEKQYKQHLFEKEPNSAYVNKKTFFLEEEGHTTSSCGMFQPGYALIMNTADKNQQIPNLPKF